MSRSLAATLLALPILGASAHAQAQDCTPARLEIILDRSSTMQTGTVAGVPKWNLARQAVDQVASHYEHTLELGLMVFPHADVDACAPGDEIVAPALANRAAIQAELAEPPPTTGSWTPMAETLAAAAELPSLRDSDKPRYAVLITDGWQWCAPYDPATRFAPIDALAGLTAAGVTTYVVGFGDGVDALTLNGLAVAAGTARPGCDPAGASPSAKACYFQADDAGGLLAALEAVAHAASAEVCDGRDNDCDGEVDEAVTRACASDCGGGTETCVDGAFVGCDAPAPEAERCDGQDNDCDGTVDPGCACDAGATRACGGAACGAGVQTCAGGAWGACEDDPSATMEMCDGRDNDCDGQVDEVDGVDDTGSLCPPGQGCDLGGNCIELGGGSPPDEASADGARPAGCAAAGSRGGPGGLLLLLGLALALRRRR